MKTPPTTRSIIRQANFTFAISAILPSHLEERRRLSIAPHRASGARPRGWHYNFGYCSRQRRVSRATMSPEIAEAARSSGLRSIGQHQGLYPVQILHLVSYLPESLFGLNLSPSLRELFLNPTSALS